MAGQRPGRGRPGQIIGILITALKFGRSGAFFHVLIALRHLVARQRRSAARAVRNDFKAFIQKTFFPDFFERPPFGFYKVVIIGNIRILHIRPKSDRIGKLFPHSLIFPDAFLAFFYKRFQSVCFNLIFSVKPELLFHFQLHGEAMRIPARFPKDMIPFHRFISWDHILDYTREHVSDVGLSICRRRTVIKCIRLSARAEVYTFSKDVMVFPKLFRFLFSLYKIQI